MLEVLHLKGSRGEKELFSNLTFSLPPGHWVWIRGINGSGKTTLLKTLAGLLPYTGKILWKGQKLERFNPLYQHTYLQELLFLSHTPALHPALTAEENLKWYATLYHSGVISAPSSLISSALESLRLLKYRNTPCEQLSFGQRQRVALARLCLQRGKLWILDEPCTALDEIGQKLFEEWLHKHLQQGGMAVVASHDSFKSVENPLQEVHL